MPSPFALLQRAVAQVPAVKYAVGVGGIASVVAIVLTGWKLDPQTAIFGTLIVLAFMVVLVIFASLAKTAPGALGRLSLFLAWCFLILTVSVAFLFVSCAFFDKPKTLPCLLKAECGSSQSLPVFDSQKLHSPPITEPPETLKKTPTDHMPGKKQSNRTENLNSAQRAQVPTTLHGQPFRNATQEAQVLLCELGYEIRFPDGFEGPRTTAFIEEFQRKYNLPVTGSADNATISTLRIRVEKSFNRKECYKDE